MAATLAKSKKEKKSKEKEVKIPTCADIWGSANHTMCLGKGPGLLFSKCFRLEAGMLCFSKV